MKGRNIGIVLLLLSALLVGLFFFQFPRANKSNVVFEQYRIKVPYAFETIDLGFAITQDWNMTLDSRNKTSYAVTALITSSVWNSSATNTTRVDFWVVNRTGRRLLQNYLDNDTYEQYMGQRIPLPGMKAYAAEIDVAAKLARFEPLDYAGIYIGTLINPYQGKVANVSVVVEEMWVETGVILPLNAASVSIVVAIAVLGVYMVVKNSSQASGKAKRIRQKQQ